MSGIISGARSGGNGDNAWTRRGAGPTAGYIVRAMAERDLDGVVCGATGVTGRRVAEYLAGRAGETGARWAAAARDSGKLASVLGDAGVEAPETIAADLNDPDSLAG